VLYFNKLPFAEDLRQYSFAPLLDNPKKAQMPNQQQLDAAEDFINALDLMEAATDADGYAPKPDGKFGLFVCLFAYQKVFWSLQPTNGGA